MRCSYQGTTTDQNGRVLPSTTVSVYLAGATTPASIYAASAGGVAVNSVVSDASTGVFIFYVDTADYYLSQLFDITFTKTNFAQVKFYKLSLYSTAAASVAQEAADTVILTPITSTTALLTNKAAAINTTGKYIGKPVWNTDSAKYVYATGTGATDVWNDAVGVLAHTPS
jgi:hypothetical protein